MSLDNLADVIFIWVSRYIAALCLVSIAVWGASMYLWARDWHTKVRDAGIYLLSSGVLTGVLALKPEKMDAYFWPPIIWFSFSMLLVIELLWIAFLIEYIVRFFKSLAQRDTQLPHRRPTVYTRYPDV
jgi:hypothetical protein